MVQGISLASALKCVNFGWYNVHICRILKDEFHLSNYDLGLMTVYGLFMIKVTLTKGSVIHKQHLHSVVTGVYYGFIIGVIYYREYILHHSWLSFIVSLVIFGIIEVIINILD